VLGCVRESQQQPLEVGIRVQPGGQFSEYVANELQVGDTLDVMPPFGRFHADVAARKTKTVLMFAAGSGITPILSIMRATLAEEADSRVILFYGNRRHTQQRGQNQAVRSTTWAQEGSCVIPYTLRN
jgi:ferredoxin-NADP reductase